jgi:large repetitive protein
MNRRIICTAHIILTLVLLVGWSARSAAAQETADLSLTKVADRTHVRVGENITYTITLTNLGPATATGITFGDPLPDQLNLVSFTCSQGTLSGGPFCAIENLASGASVTATLIAVPDVGKHERHISNTAFIVESATPDPDGTNNSASVLIKVIGPIP